MSPPDPSDAPAGVLTTLRELPRPAVVLLFGIALNRAGSFVALFLVLYLTSLGYSPFVAGLSLTVFGTGSIAGTLVGGSAASRFGPRRTIIASMLLAGVAVAAVAVVEALVPLLVICCAAGFFSQMYRPAAATLLAEVTPPGRLVMVSAASRLGLNLGASVGPLVGIWLATYSYPAVFLVNAATDVAFALVALLALPDTRPHPEPSPSPEREREREYGHPPATGPGATSAATADRPATYRDLRHDRRFLLVLAGMFLTAVAEVQYQSTLPLEIQHRDLPVALYGAVVALNGALVIAFELPLTHLLQRIPMRTTIALGSLLLGCGLALFGLPAGIWIFFLGTLLWTLGEIVSAPSVVAYPALAAPTQRLRSRYIAALTAVQAAGWAVGPSIGTALFQYRSTAVWQLCAVLGVATFVIMWRGVRPPPPPPAVRGALTQVAGSQPRPLR